MACIANDGPPTGGKRRILFVDGDGRRRTIRLGKCSLKDAQQVLGKVEALVEAIRLGNAVRADVAAWIAGLPDATHDKLARVDLVEARDTDAPEVHTLGKLVDAFVNMANVKASTKAAYKQATKSLETHFGRSMAVDTITVRDADDWHKAIRDEDLAPSTVSKRVKIARAIFGKAVRWEWIDRSPFRELKAGKQTNRERMVYVDRHVIARVIDECPDDQWAAVFALARYAGLRCPSEIVLLRWADINWSRGPYGVMSVRSPKTEAHAGQGSRFVPISADLHPILMQLFDAAEEGEERVVPFLRSAGTNLRTHAHRIITRAGESPWCRLFQNLRSSCEIDWNEVLPVHAAAAFIGHSVTIAAEHYLSVRDTHIDAAASVGGTAACRVNSQGFARTGASIGTHRSYAKPCEVVRNVAT